MWLNLVQPRSFGLITGAKNKMETDWSPTFSRPRVSLFCLHNGPLLAVQVGARVDMVSAETLKGMGTYYLLWKFCSNVLPLYVCRSIYRGQGLTEVSIVYCCALVNCTRTPGRSFPGFSL